MRRIIALATVISLICFNINSFHARAEFISNDVYDKEALKCEVVNYNDEMENSSDDKLDMLTRKDAKDVAETQAEIVAMSDFESSWTLETKAGKATPLYDTDENVVAYEIDMYTGIKKSGYIIVGADEKHPPIIEYAMEGDFWSQTKMAPGEHLIYDGELNYYKTREGSTKVEDIWSHEKIDKYELENSVESVDNDGLKKVYKKQWDAFESGVEKRREETQNLYDEVSPQSSDIYNPLLPGAAFRLCDSSIHEDYEKFIESRKDNSVVGYHGLANPEIYESGFKKFSYGEVPSCRMAPYLSSAELEKKDGDDVKYFLEWLKKHVGGELYHPCVAYAETNLIAYWDMRKRQGRLLKNNSTYDTLIDFFKRIKQQKDSGMEWIDKRKLIYDYLKSINKENVVMYEYIFDDFKKKGKKKLNTTEALLYQWEFIKRQIDVEKDPFLLDLPPETYYYGDGKVGHQVLVLGYRQYDYAKKQFDTDLNMSGYLMINDGITETGHSYWDEDGKQYNYTDYTFKPRYINYSMSKIYESWIMTTCHFIGK